MPFSLSDFFSSYKRSRFVSRHQRRLASIRVVGFDFDGVFTTNLVWVTEAGAESVACSRSDGIGLSLLPGLGVKAAIFSTEINPVVSMRAKKLKIECFQNCANKSERMAEWLKSLAIPPTEAAFVGNDVNDVACMRSVGLAVAVADA
ncbi:hypothetical protein E3A20_26410, partial [Planctomyces bekefii]